jgi:hypothetical protein
MTLQELRDRLTKLAAVLPPDALVVAEAAGDSSVGIPDAQFDVTAAEGWPYPSVDGAGSALVLVLGC